MARAPAECETSSCKVPILSLGKGWTPGSSSSPAFCSQYIKNDKAYYGLLRIRSSSRKKTTLTNRKLNEKIYFASLFEHTGTID